MPRTFSMRSLLLVLLIAGIAGCGRDPIAPPVSSTLIFRAASNCPTGTVELTVDDVVKGNYAMHPNATVKSFTVDAGAHTAEAREIGGSGLTWPRINFNVRENESFTLDMTCP
jgi:hypothetical protein